MRLSDYVVNFLVENELCYPFMITGRGSLYLNDAVARNEKMQPVFPHHEQSASFSAAGAAALENQLQLVMTSTGCAATNTVTGVLSAWQDFLPILFISGNNHLRETTAHSQLGIRTFGQQEANIIELITPITKYAAMVTDASRIRYHLEKAKYAATSGKKGPVWIDIPLDIQNTQIEPDALGGFFQQKTKPKKIRSLAIKSVIEKLSACNRPAFLIGSGVSKSGAEKTLRTFSEKFNIPVVYTNSAVDTVPYSHQNCVGSIGSQGCMRSGAFTIQNADLIIILGSRLGTLITGPDFQKFGRDAYKIIVDIDPIEHSKDSIPFELLIEADVKDFLERISDNYKHLVANEKWINQCRHWKNSLNLNKEFVSTSKKLDLYDFAQELPDMLPDDGIFVCDSGFADVILPTNSPFKNGQRCIRPISQGAMGYALPASIGLSITSKKQVLVVVGDGSIMFNLQELETLVRYNCNVKIIVINNSMYSIIRRRQKELFRKRVIGVDETSGLKTPDFGKISQSFGLPFQKLTVQDYAREIQNSMKKSGPALLEIAGKIEQEYIEIGYAKIADRRYVRRPLEDQRPFIDRDLFLSNMLIDPIDQ